MKKIILAFIALLTLAGSANAQIGSLSSDLVFTPVTPCRILDTRNAGSKSGILQANTVRGFWGWGPNFTAQGGSATTCGIWYSSNTAAILVNFTVVTPDTGGYITAFPADVLDANKPLAATVNFTAGSVVGNNATIKLKQINDSNENDFKIYSTSNVHVVADVVGFYSKPVATALNCKTIAGFTTTIAAGATANAYAPTCDAGFTLTGTNCRASSYNVYFAVSDDGQCSAKNTSVDASTITALARCCQIPGR
jgi:hypothetical protein